MSQTVITVYCGGEWKEEGGLYCWCKGNNDKPIAIVIDAEITLVNLVEKLYLKLGVDRSKMEMKLSFMSTSWDASDPIYLINDDDVSAFLMDRDGNNRRGSLRVELIEKDESGEHVLNDLEERLHVEDENKGCDDANTREQFHDTYFDCVFMDANTFGVASTPDVEGTNITGAGEENMVPNDSVTSALTSASSLEPEFYAIEDCERAQLKEPVLHTFTDGINFQIGQKFASKLELKNKLLEAAIKNCFEMKPMKSCKTLYEVRCVDERCKWRLRATKLPNSNFFSIRTYTNTHSYSLEKRKKKHRQATAAVVADTIRKNFNEIKETPTPKAIMGMMSNAGAEVSYWKAWMGIKIANNLKRGSPEESFELLPRYLYMAEKVNPDTITHLELDKSNRFKYLFLAFGATIRGFSCMRKVISIDGTFLKTEYKSCLLVATALDGDRHCYPIAWAVVDSENDKAWAWFLTKLREIIPDDGDLAFISDRNQSIKNAVGNVYKNAHHGYCMWHIKQNLQGRYTCADAINLFLEAAQAYQVSHFNQVWNEIQNRYPTVATYLTKNMDRSHWSRAYFRGNRYNIMTTGASESINNAIKDAREYPLLSMLDKIQEITSDWFYKHRKAAASSNTPLTPATEVILRERFIVAQQMKVRPLSPFEYNVTGSELDAVVDLSQKRCSCRVFDIDRLPCAHALAAVEDLQAICKLTSHYYTVETWALAYVETIYPVPPTSEWDIPESVDFVKVLPPIISKERGRKKKKRIPSIGETKRRNRCIICGQLGHSKSTCPLRATLSEGSTSYVCKIRAKKQRKAKKDAQIN